MKRVQHEESTTWKECTRKKCSMKNQCIMVRQWTARYPFVHYSALFLCTFFVAIYIFSCFTFFMLHLFHVPLFSYAPFPWCTFLCSNLSMLHFFRVALILCIALFHVTFLQVTMFSFCILLLLHSSHFVAFFSVELCSCCTISRSVAGNPTDGDLRWRA